jgi:regulator of cell morphogenesis and NO signaling
MSIDMMQTVGQLAAHVLGATREFEKLGIDYCCGGNRSLGEACVDAKLSVDQVLARLKGLAVAGPEPDRPWTNESLSGLIEHISNKHHVFICEEGPHIQASAAKVVGAHGQNHPELLEAKQIFDDLSNELSVHLMKEEQILFPFVFRMEEAAAANEPAPLAMFGTVANPVRMMMQEHDGAGKALRKLRALTNNYAAPADACISYKALYDPLKGFEADLHQHIHLENNILFPRVIALEARQ